MLFIQPTVGKGIPTSILFWANLRWWFWATSHLAYCLRGKRKRWVRKRICHVHFNFQICTFIRLSISMCTVVF